LDYFSGMGELNLEDIKLFLSDPEAARRKLAQDREEQLEVTPEQLLKAWKTLLSDVDAQALTGEFAEVVVESLRSGLEPGDQGWWDDEVASLSPWGFEFESIRVPVKIWHGRQDRFVPFQHGEWLAEHVPGAQAALSETDGHLTLLIDKVGDLHDWLLSHL
jgi:pimeloyl-ACP methyl ester carboxylesterase